MDTSTQKDRRDEEGMSLTQIFNTLPLELKEGIGKIGLREKIRNIVRKNSLGETDSSVLEDQVILFVFLINTESGFVENLEEQISDKSKVDSVVKDVAIEIFNPLSQSVLASINQERSGVKTKTVELSKDRPSVDKEAQGIGQRHGLRVDELGILEEEIQKRVTGEKEGRDFHKDIQKRLSLDDEKRDAIIEDVNKQIFEKIRGSMRKKKEEETLKREDILKEIEGQTKPEQEDPAGETKDFLSGNVEERETPSEPPKESRGQGDTKEIFEEKLGTTTESTPTSPKKYKGVDPYREVIE